MSLVYEHVYLANSSGHTLKIYTHFHMLYFGEDCVKISKVVML